MSYDIFISYSRKNTDIADEICAAFDKAGIRYFIDRQDLSGATELPEVLVQAILDSRLVFFIAGRESYQSLFTKLEIQCAFKNKKIILPYFIDDAKIPFQLKHALNNIIWRHKKHHPISVIVEDVLSVLDQSSTNKVIYKAEQKRVFKKEESLQEQNIWEEQKPLERLPKKSNWIWEVILKVIFNLLSK